MLCVIPLAGPEFVSTEGVVKPLVVIDEKPLLRRTLESRRWWQTGQLTSNELIFVMRDIPEARQFQEKNLSLWYPGAKTVFLSGFTCGAALSALAGLSMVAEYEGPICIDLVDIIYSCSYDPISMFEQNSMLGAIVPTFDSDSPAYSYLELNSKGHAVRAAEKRVISHHASAGTYFFAAPSTYLRAVSEVLKVRDEVLYNDLFYVCPLINGVVSSGMTVVAPRVENVEVIKV